MLRRIFLVVVMVMAAAHLALAHDTWIEKRNGEFPVLRGHNGKVEAYDSALVKEARALDTKGQVVEMEIVKNKENAALLTKGNPIIVGALYDSGYWLKTTDGWKKATKREGKGKYDIVESIKSKQWCKTILAPSSESSKAMGQGFEVVPQKDPTTVRVGDKLPVKVVFDGKPVEGAVVGLGGGHESDKKDPLKTDKAGMASVIIEKPGPQLVKATYTMPIKDDPDADALHLASTMTFESK
jgi:nickel transport protein